jgi:hypothetical protein
MEISILQIIKKMKIFLLRITNKILINQIKKVGQNPLNLKIKKDWCILEKLTLKKKEVLVMCFQAGEKEKRSQDS